MAANTTLFAITPSLRDKAIKLNAYVKAYSATCINVPYAHPEEHQTLSIATIVADYITGERKYAARYAEIPSYFNGNINDPAVVEVFVNELTDKMFDALDHCYMAVNATRSIQRTYDRHYYRPDGSFVEQEYAQSMTTLAPRSPTVPRSPTIPVAPLSPSRYFTAVSTGPKLDPAAIAVFQARHQALPQGRVLDVSNMNYATLAGIRNVVRPVSARSNKYSIPEVNVISNDWERYVYALQLLNPAYLQMPSFLMLKRQLGK